MLADQGTIAHGANARLRVKIRRIRKLQLLQSLMTDICLTSSKTQIVGQHHKRPSTRTLSRTNLTSIGHQFSKEIHLERRLQQGGKRHLDNSFSMVEKESRMVGSSFSDDADKQ